MAARLVLGMLFLTVIVSAVFIVSFWYFNQKDEREHERQMKREEREHEERQTLFEDEDL